MFRKMFCIFVSIVLVCNMIWIATAEVDPMTMLYDCKTPFGNFQANKDTEKGDCVAYSFTGSTFNFASSVKFAPKDATGLDTLALDIYFSDVNMLANMSELYLEITSSGTCDHAENAWPLQSVLKPDKLQNGWNTIYLYLSDSYVTDGACDLSAINYIRIFASFDGLALRGETIKFDNIRMIWTGGYDYSDISLDFYRGDNLDTDIRIVGQSEPDLANRHANITTTIGR